MATIFKNPKLTDYFQVVEDVTAQTPVETIPSYVDAYEAGKVLYFKNLKFDIDFNFWANIETEKYEGLKKMLCYVDTDTQGELITKALRKAESPPDLSAALAQNMSALFAQVMPIYYRIFDGYQYPIKRAVFRLKETLNENLHFDTYKDTEVFPDHFARMFINLDTQPRIWHTSYTVDEIYEKFGRNVPKRFVDDATANRFWRELNHAAFGKGHEWWDGSPRHIIYFEPGDVWVVDSRQISHQIYYGRRAISIDFVVARDTMRDQSRHYLTLAEKYREGVRGGAGAPKPAGAIPPMPETTSPSAAQAPSAMTEVPPASTEVPTAT
jgi:hypothetical protein